MPPALIESQIFHHRSSLHLLSSILHLHGESVIGRGRPALRAQKNTASESASAGPMSATR